MTLVSVDDKTGIGPAMDRTYDPLSKPYTTSHYLFHVSPPADGNT